MSGLAACSFWAMIGTGLLHMYPAMWTCFAVTVVADFIDQTIVAARGRAAASGVDRAMRLQAEYTAAAIARLG